MQITHSELQTAASLPVLSYRKTQRSADIAVRSGHHLFHEGERASRLYRIKSGEFRLTRLTECGRRQVIAFGYPGDILGFPSDGLHHSNCDALTDAVVTSFPSKLLEDAKLYPELHQRFLDAALREISDMQDHFMMLAKKSAVERVATFLKVLADRTGETVDGGTVFRIVMPRADIADYIGLTTETVCRTLTQLRKRKVIDVHNIQTVIVHDLALLHALAEGDEGRA